MRKHSSLPRRVVFVFLLVLAAAVLSALLVLRASMARLDGSVSARTLGAAVTIERDALGTATLRGASRDDVAFALGFVHAQERFFEMDLMRRAAAGELSELVGSAALKLDRERRVFRMRARAAPAVAAISASDRATLGAYRDGVNAGLAALAARPWEYWLLGSTPRPWTMEDSILVLDAMFFDLDDSSNARELAFAKIRAALPESVYKFLSSSGGPWDAPLLGPALNYPPLPPPGDIDVSKLDAKLLRMPVDKAGTAPAAHAAAGNGHAAAARSMALADAQADAGQAPGSNSFAVSGELTATHAALVANDMHLNLRVPNIWFRTRMIYPNLRRENAAGAARMVDLVGVTLPGIPALVAGSNGHVAWGFTNSYGDWTDWVRVIADGRDPARYRTPDGSQPVREFDEIIKVRGGADETLGVRETIWGPIIAKDADGTQLALAWTALVPGALNTELDRLDQAETVDEAIAIANRAGMPPNNFVVGDRSGNIGWTIAGRIPRREGGYDPMLPSDWSRPGTGWNGWVDADAVPRLPNPPGQRLWTANARTLDVESPDYALLRDGGYDLGARARQIRDDLEARTRFAPDDALAIQLDDRALLLEHWHVLLQRLIANTPDLDPAKKYFADWNGRADPASVGYRLTRSFRNEVIDTVLDGIAAAVRVKDADFAMPRLAQAEIVVDAILLQQPAHLLPPGYANWDDLLRQCAERVVRKLGAEPGGLAARTWGETNTAKIRHALSAAVPAIGRWLDMPADQLPGDSNMPRVAGASFGASERFAVEPGHEEYGYFHMPAGQSDHPLSPFYGAGHEDWVKGRATPFLPGATKYTLTLQPQ